MVCVRGSINKRNNFIMNKQKLLTQLSSFTGTNSYYKTAYPQILITDGVAFLCENADCFWLIDEIASAILGEPRLNRIANKNQILFWTLEQTHNKHAILKCETDTDHIVYRKIIQFTDFPFEVIGNKQRLYMQLNKNSDGNGYVFIVCLPSEY